MEGLRNNKLAEDLLHLALLQGASDLHIEPDGQGVRVRIRVDGLLQQLCVLYGYCRKKSAAGWQAAAGA